MTAGTQAKAGEANSVVEKLWPIGPTTVGRARHLLTRSLNAWGLEHLAEDAELIVSELVTNSVRHAHEPRGHVIQTRFERLHGGVRIEVHDANVNKPEPRSASTEDESGRGLILVELITGGRWGVSDRIGIGKMVWAVCADGGVDGTPT
ncbi:ATP-binding protein [Streptomyces sp. NBC_00433]